jgi:uncharacterized membrane protein YagU involved in acid resistance
MVKLQVLGNNSKTVNNIKHLTWGKNDQHSKIYLPCNFEVNLITHLGFSIFSLVAILVGSRDHRTQIWKGVIQGPFHQSLVAIGPVVSEEKIKM